MHYLLAFVIRENDVLISVMHDSLFFGSRTVPENPLYDPLWINLSLVLMFPEGCFARWVIFYKKKWGFVYTICQLLIIWLCQEVVLALGAHLSGHYQCEEDAIIERLKKIVAIVERWLFVDV